MIISSEPPRLKEESKWDKGFRDLVYDCLQKNPTQRPTATELLEKHAKFFSKACSPDDVIKSLLIDVPNLEDRVSPAIWDEAEKYKKERDNAFACKGQSEHKYDHE